MLDYISEVFLFWAMKPIAELVLAGIVLLVIVVAFAMKGLKVFLRQARCKHEDGSSTSWCQKCGKNLKLIG
jgi:hypothetical protein